MRKKYKLEFAITTHDLKQIKKEPPSKKIKTKNKLAQLVHKTGKVEGTKVSIYHKISRYEEKGFKTENTTLTEALLEVLEVSRDELIEDITEA